MSLDVHLRMKHPFLRISKEPRIYIREYGQTRTITREEWDRRFPDREPIAVAVPEADNEVFSANITHNLGRMADEAGLYTCLWRPEKCGITTAADLIGPLTCGLGLLRNDPQTFKTLNPPNGWGDYDGLVRFVEDYLAACIAYPEAEVSVSR